MAKNPKGHVIRVSHRAFDELAKLRSSFGAVIVKGKAKEYTYSMLMDSLVACAQIFQSGKRTFIAGDQNFDNIAEARGHAVRIAVRNKSNIELPEIALIIGKDEGE